jgi:hypothetical protein
VELWNLERRLENLVAMGATEVVDTVSHLGSSGDNQLI